MEIFQNRKKFDPVATTGSEAITTLSAVGLIGSFVLFLMAITMYNLQFKMYNLQFLFFIICNVSLIIHVLGVRKFLVFVYKEEGLAFTVKSFFTGIALYLFIFSGAVWGFMRKQGRVILRASESHK